MNKKELKQKIAEIFANKNITTKSHHIRELIEENVSDDLKIVENMDLKYLKDKIFHIDGRQKTGYETFRNVKKNQEVMIKQLNSIKRAILCLCVSIFAFPATIIAIEVFK